MPSRYVPELSGIDSNGNDFRFPLSLVNADATLNRAVSVQEIIDSNGAFLDDMGAKVGKFRFRAAFLGSSELGNQKEYIPSIEEGEELWEFFEEFGEELVFVHPSLGAKNGRISSISRREADEIDALFFDFEFLEEGVDPNPLLEVDVVAECERGFKQTIADETSNISDDVIGLFGAEGNDLLALDLDPDKSILDQVGDFSKGVREFAANIDSQIQVFEGALEAVTNPANSLIAVIDYGTGLPGRILGSIAKVGERYKELYNTLLDAPSKFVESLRQGLEDLESLFTGDETERSLKAVNSQNLALGTASSYEIDQERRIQLKQIEEADSFDAEGNLLNREESPGEVQNLTQIEKSLAQVRDALQKSIDDNRQTNDGGEISGVKISAEALLFHIVKTKAEIDRIRTIEIVSGSLPLHVLLNSEGETFNKAERVLSLNDIKNPTFSEGEVAIYAG